MPTTPKIAFAVLAGYALGRTRKMKLAITLAGLGVGRRINADPKQLLEQGAKFLESSPELTKLGGDLRGRLYDAAKTATTTAAANQVDSLSRKLDERAESLRGAGETDRNADAADPSASTTDDADPQRTGRASPEEQASRGEAQQRSPATSALREEPATESEPATAGESPVAATEER